MNPENAEQTLQELNQVRQQLAVEHPAAKEVLKIASDPQFLSAVQEIAKHPNFKTYCFYELGFAAAFWTLRIVFSHSKASRNRTFLRNLMVSILNFLIFWTVTLVILPYWQFGSSFEKLVRAFGIQPPF